MKSVPLILVWSGRPGGGDPLPLFWESLDLSPSPDNGNREESNSAESEDDSEIEASSDASSRDSTPETKQEVEPSREVTPRMRRPGGPRVSIVNCYNCHRIREKQSPEGSSLHFVIIAFMLLLTPLVLTWNGQCSATGHLNQIPPNSN